MNAANYLTSDRLDKMYDALWSNPEGLTTAQLQRLTRSCSVATDVSELRRNGFIINCEYMGTRNGRRIYRYKLEG